jgi:hypothetical protein
MIKNTLSQKHNLTALLKRVIETETNPYDRQAKKRGRRLCSADIPFQALEPSARACNFCPE